MIIIKSIMNKIKFYINIIIYGQGLVLGINGGAGVALFLGIAPVAFIAVKGHVYLTLLQLGFLQANHIRVQSREGLHEVLFRSQE